MSVTRPAVRPVSRRLRPDHGPAFRPASAGSRFRPAIPVGRFPVVGVLAAVTLTAGAGVASAHVSVNPGTAVAGSYTKLTFRVPNESARAATSTVTVDFPMDHPFASVSLKKEPGWTARATTTKLPAPITQGNATITQAVSSISWTADAGAKISLGEFAEFEVSVGPVPTVASVAFRAVQTYDDGTVVKWNEPTPASGAEPEHPAPELTITGAPAASTSTGMPSTSAAGASVGPAVAVAASAPTPQSGGADGTARALAIVGILVGAVGLLVAALAVRRPRVTR